MDDATKERLKKLTDKYAAEKQATAERLKASATESEANFAEFHRISDRVIKPAIAAVSAEMGRGGHAIEVHPGPPPAALLMQFHLGGRRDQAPSVLTFNNQGGSGVGQYYEIHGPHGATQKFAGPSRAFNESTLEVIEADIVDFITRVFAENEERKKT